MEGAGTGGVSGMEIQEDTVGPDDDNSGGTGVEERRDDDGHGTPGA